MKTIAKKPIDYVLINYVTGEASFEEQARAEKWIAKAPENNCYYQQFKDLWIRRVIL